MTQPPILPFWEFFASFNINKVIQGFSNNKYLYHHLFEISSHDHFATFPWAFVSGIFAEDGAWNGNLKSQKNVFAPKCLYEVFA